MTVGINLPTLFTTTTTSNAEMTSIKLQDRKIIEQFQSTVSYYDECQMQFEKYYIESFHNDFKMRLEVNTKNSALIDLVEKREISDGEAKLKRFEEILESGFTWKRHLFQRMFHNEVVKGLARMIVGKDWPQVGPRIIKERGWTQLAQMVMANAPRRFGKSVSVAMIAIAFAEVMEGLTQAIFSTGRRASKNLLDICYKLALERGLGESIVRYNQEELWIRTASGKVSKIFSYPANAKISSLVLIDDLFIRERENYCVRFRFFARD